MAKVFIYWDTSNIFISAQEAAAEQEGEQVRSRMRIHFRNLLALARANRPVQHAVAVGSIPPEMRQVWNRLENEGVTVEYWSAAKYKAASRAWINSCRRRCSATLLTTTAPPALPCY